MAARRLTGPVGETPEPESRRSAQSDHKTQPGAPSPGWSEDTHRCIRQTNTRKGGSYQKHKPRPGGCCEWAGDDRRRKAEHGGGVGTPHSHGASGMVIGSGAGEVGSVSWRSRARRLVGSVARLRGGSPAHRPSWRDGETPEPESRRRQPRKRKKIAVLTKLFMGEAADLAQPR